MLVLRRGSIPRVPCDTRHVNRASCYSDFVQEVSWDGEAGPQRALERPGSVSYWAAFTATEDGTLWAIGADRQNRGMVGRYTPGSTLAELSPIAASIDGGATIAAVVGGVAVFASDETVWYSPGTVHFEPTSDPLVRVLLDPPEDETGAASSPERGITLDGVGTLSIFGSVEDGYTSRLSTPDGEVLLRMIDAHSRVRAVARLRALSTGHAVALLQRTEPSPDAVVLTTDFGRSWVAEPAPE